MWYEINNNSDIISFMNKIYYFHDSCIKEIKYLSGAYVDEKLSMYPINDRRILKVIIQRQFEDNSMIEMEFKGLRYLQLLQMCIRDSTNSKSNYVFLFIYVNERYCKSIN